MPKLTTIEGIGEAFEAKLKEAGIGSTTSLLSKGATKRGRMAISEVTGIDESQVLRFVNHADLMRIKGIGGEYSELLEAASVDSDPELARRNAANPTDAINEANAAKKLVRMVPSESMVTKWTAQAKKLKRAVHH